MIPGTASPTTSGNGTLTLAARSAELTCEA